MIKKNEEILKNLCNLYLDLYKAKDLFNKNYFKNTPEEVGQALNEIIDPPLLPTKKKKTEKPSSVLSIKTQEQVNQFYKTNLIFNDDNEKKQCLKKISLDDLKYLYNILYSLPAKKSATKEYLVESIGRFFESIDRALSLKP